MAEISGNLPQYFFGVRYALCRLATWMNTAFGTPVAAATVPVKKPNAECEAVDQTDMLQLFAEDLHQATDWHVRHRERT